MFTGIIEARAEVKERLDTGLVLVRPSSFNDIAIGCSICISGTCLTVTAFDDQTMQFDVIPETWERTKLGTLKKGDSVNLERALKVGDRLDGHIVQGHIDVVGVVIDVFDSGKEGAKREKRKEKNERNSHCHGEVARTIGNVILNISYPQELRGLIVEKGSIAIDGVSLTVASVDEDQFSVALIPMTLTETTLGALQKGDPVNLEADVMGRYIRSSH